MLAKHKRQSFCKSISYTLGLLCACLLLSGCPPEITDNKINVNKGDIYARSVFFYWTKATDEDDDKLDYYVYYSNSPNIQTVADMENNGTLLRKTNSRFQLNSGGDIQTPSYFFDFSQEGSIAKLLENSSMISVLVYNLQPTTKYYFNVIVECSEDNEKAAYKMVEAVTSSALDIRDQNLKYNSDSESVTWKHADTRLISSGHILLSSEKNRGAKYAPHLHIANYIVYDSSNDQNYNEISYVGNNNSYKLDKSIFDYPVYYIKVKAFVGKPVASYYEDYYLDERFYNKLVIKQYGDMNAGDVIIGSVKESQYKHHRLKFQSDEPGRAKIKISGRVNPPNLYIRKVGDLNSRLYDSTQHTIKYDSSGNWFIECVLNMNSPEDLFISVHGVNGDADYTLEAEISGVPLITPANPVNASFSSSTEPDDALVYYKASFGTDAEFSVKLSGLENNADLYAQVDRTPTFSDFICKSDNFGSEDEECSVKLNAGQTLYIGLLSYNKGNYQLSVSNPRMILADVDFAQDDDWSCGAHSAHRILKTYGHNHYYYNVRSKIGKAEPFEIGLDVVVDQILKTKEICEYKKEWVFISFITGWGWEFVLYCYTVEVLEDVFGRINVTLPVGQPPGILADKLTSHYRSADYASNQDFDDIKSLIDRQIPVMALVQNGKKKLGIDKGVVKIYDYYPKLHWIVISGYDEHNIYYYETENYEDINYGVNDMRSMSWGDFLVQWAWQYDGYEHKLIHNAMVNAGIARPRTILWLNR